MCVLSHQGTHVRLVQVNRPDHDIQVFRLPVHWQEDEPVSRVAGLFVKKIMKNPEEPSVRAFPPDEESAISGKEANSISARHITPRSEG